MITKPTMNAARFEQLIKQLGWTKRGAALFLGASDRTLLRWIAEDNVARSAAMVLELMVEKNLSAEEVLTIARVRPAQIKFILANLSNPVGRPHADDKDK